MFGLLLLMFTVVPALELYLLFSIGAQIGGLNTIIIIITTGILGAGLAKSQGLQILKDMQTKANQGELPGDQIIQGLMVFAGGLLLLTPGFMTDIIGFSLVLPGTRHLIMVLVKSRLHQSIKNGNFHMRGFGMGETNTNGASFYSFTSRTYQSPGSVENIDKTLPPNTFEAEFEKKE